MQALWITRHESTGRGLCPKGSLWGIRHLQGLCLESIVMGWGSSKAAAMKIQTISGGRGPEIRSSEKHKKSPRAEWPAFSSATWERQQYSIKLCRQENAVLFLTVFPSSASPPGQKEEGENHVGPYWKGSPAPSWPGCPKRAIPSWAHEKAQN